MEIIANIEFVMMLYLYMLANIIALVALMLFETYSIYEYRTCENYENRPLYNDYVFICDWIIWIIGLSFAGLGCDYNTIVLRDLVYILNKKIDALLVF